MFNFADGRAIALRAPAWVGAAIIGAVAAPAAAYEICEPVAADAPANNLAPVPSGEVDNLADEGDGVALPGSGIVGPSSMPPPDAQGVYKSIYWGPLPLGSVRWQEPSRSCKTSSLLFDFWPALGYQGVPDGVLYPTIVYFHPNGVTHHFEKDSTINDKLAKVAHDHHYNFISVEFRHPKADEYLAAKAGYGGQVPHGDAGAFIQFLRQRADQMKVDTHHIFAFGHSRGALALWQALQLDKTDQPYSHQVAGFVGYNAQTSYGCDAFSLRYLVQNTDTSDYLAQCHLDHFYDSQMGDAVGSVRSISDPKPTKLPVMLQYKQAFYLESGSLTQIRPITVANMRLKYGSADPKDDGSLHYPNFGMALYNQYNDALINGPDRNELMARPQDKIPESDQFIGWEAFVAGLLDPP